MPKRPDEVALWAAVRAGESPREAGERLGIPRRRMEYLCDKWSRKGLYDWGVVIDRGWLTDKGRA